MIMYYAIWRIFDGYRLATFYFFLMIYVCESTLYLLLDPEKVYFLSFIGRFIGIAETYSIQMPN